MLSTSSAHLQFTLPASPFQFNGHSAIVRADNDDAARTRHTVNGFDILMAIVLSLKRIKYTIRPVPDSFTILR